MGTLLDLASLVMIPSGVKEDKLYSVKPTDGSGDFTFSRNSDIQATRVNSSGLIEKAKVNNLLQSNTFSNASWDKNSTSLTSGQSGYDGSSDAWLLTKSASGANIAQNVSQSGLSSISLYLKANASNWVTIQALGGANPLANFDLVNGVVGVTGSVADATIEAVGATGWYRCTMVVNVSLTTIIVYPANADNDRTATSGSIYIQDAQLNYGLIAQDYVETTTTSVVEGITADLPRLDYSGGASCPSLLLEPSRTNVVTLSEMVTTSVTNVGYTATENDTISPEGVVNAGKLLETTGTTHLSQKNFSVGSTTDSYAVSFFVKGIGRTRGDIRYGISAPPYNEIYATFNLSDGTITNAIASGTGAVAGESDIEPMGNDWYRITLSGVVGVAGGHYARLFGRDDSGNITYVGDPTKGFNVYGFQAELGSYPTSYIPTYGASAQRNADSASKTGISSLIGQTEGTMFVEVDAKVFEQMAASETQRLMMVSDGSNTNRVLMNFYIDGSNRRIELAIVSGGSIQASMGYTVTAGNKVYKIAGAYKTNDFALYVDGVEKATDTSGSTFSGTTLSRLDVGQDRTGTLQQSNPIKQTLLFPTRLTNAELAALTTI